MTLGSTDCPPVVRAGLPRTFSVIPAGVEESLLLSSANDAQKCLELSRLRST